MNSSNHVRASTNDICANASNASEDAYQTRNDEAPDLIMGHRLSNLSGVMSLINFMILLSNPGLGNDGDSGLHHRNKKLTREHLRARQVRVHRMGCLGSIVGASAPATPAQEDSRRIFESRRGPPNRPTSILGDLLLSCLLEHISVPSETPSSTIHLIILQFGRPD